MTPISRANIAGALALLAVFGAVAHAQDGKTPDYAAIVAAPGRVEGDRTADARRKPAQLLAFAEVKTGMKVLDMETNSGYSAELLARAIGPTGKVYAQDSAAVIERFVKDKFDIRAHKPLLREEIEAAGFKLAAEADFLRNPDDPRDTKVFQPAIPVDEFVLKYRKPE